jgi:predicted transcriptional regulator
MRGSFHTLINVTKKGDVITVSCPKMKDDEPFKDLKYKLQQVTLDDGQTSCVVVSLDGSKQAASDAVSDSEETTEIALTPEQHRAFEVVAKAKKAGVRRRDIMRDAQLSDNATTKVLKTLQLAGLIHQPEKGQSYFITEGGKDYLAAEKYFFTFPQRAPFCFTFLSPPLGGKVNRSGSNQERTPSQ